MYKLVAVAGKLRGEEFILQEGENIAGRDADCNVCLEIEGVSKRHFSITVTGDTCYLKDLGSSNGTFLNEKMISGATVKDKDKIVVPDTILQVVYVQEKKIIIRKAVEDEDDEDEFIRGGRQPDEPLEKALWFIKYKVMNHLHGLNEEYEWHHLIPFMFLLFGLICITLIVFPVMDNNKTLLINEIAERGYHYIQELSRINYEALNNGEIEKIDTEWITKKDEGTEGVTGYRLMDMEGRIVRPSTKLNEYVRDPHFVLAWELAQSQASQGSQSGRPFVRPISSDTILIGKSIWAFSRKTARQEPIGIVAIKFAPRSLKEHIQKINSNFLESLVKVGIAMVIFFGIFYFLTLRPVEELRFQFEEGLRGNRKNIESRYIFSELDKLKNSINTSLQRIRELSAEEGDEVIEEESDEKYVASLHEFMQGAQGPAMVLDGHKNLSYINLEAEDLCGIRESSSQGMALLDVSREQGFAATVIELCDNSANNNGTFQEGHYELSGVPYKICVVCLIGKDNFAKSFYITFIKDD